MNIFVRIIEWLTLAGRWIAIAAMTVMMLFTTFAVISRNAGFPVVGDVEVVQLSMVILIMFALAFTQKADAHISIGLLVDRLPEKVQNTIDVFAFLATFIICIVIGWVSLSIGLDSMSGRGKSTDLLNIPHYPFRMIIAFGFTLWGFQALLNALRAMMKLLGRESIGNEY